VKIRSKLITLATLPVVLLVILTALFLGAASQVERAANKAIVAQDLANQLAALSILTYEHHIYYEERAHVQWLEKYQSIGTLLKEEEAFFDSDQEKDLLSRLSRNYRNLGFLFEQYGPHTDQDPSQAQNEQVANFRNRITARLLQELAIITPVAQQLHALNHDQSIALSEKIDAASIVVVGSLVISLLVGAFLVIRAFSVPVRRLNEACAKISAGDLSCRIRSQSPDELGVLARSFDGMAERLETSDQALRRMNVDLEAAVQERTLELSEANEELSRLIDIRLQAEQALKLNEDRLSALLDLNQQRFDNEDQITRHSLEEAVRITGSQVGYLHFFDEEQQTLGLYHWSEAAQQLCTAAKTPHYPLADAGVWADCIRLRQPAIHNDYPSLATRKGVPEGHFPVLRHMSIPVFDEGKIVAVVGIGNKKTAYNDADARQLTLYMQSTWEILKRKRAETQRNESEQRYRAIFNESPDGILLIDAESTRAVEFNETAHLQLGYSREEFAQLTVADYEAPNTPEENKVRTERIARLGGSKFDTVHRTKSGVLRNVAVSLQSLVIGGRQYIYAIFRDTTELRKAQEEALFKAKLLDAASDSIFLVDGEGTIVLVNEAAHKTRGYQREEIIGMSVTTLDLPEFASQAGPRIQQIIERGECVFESAHRCKDGSVMPVEIHAQSLAINGERLILSSARDISERRESEATLREYASSLERSNKELEHFAYVASHDLQEPLRKIGSFTELLARKYQDKLDDKAGVYIGYIVDGAHRMQILINDLLSFSRVTTKGREFARVDCNALVARVQQDVEFVVQEKGAVLDVAELPTVMADEVQLGQVFQNLITNAIKYCEAGRRPEVRIAAQKKGAEWVFSVSDNGIGIEPQHFERIFQLFQRLHTREEYSGTGIGLALCKKIIERHGGHIWVESESDGGSTFFFTLPRSSGQRSTRQTS